MDESRVQNGVNGALSAYSLRDPNAGTSTSELERILGEDVAERVTSLMEAVSPVAAQAARRERRAVEERAERFGDDSIQRLGQVVDFTTGPPPPLEYIVPGLGLAPGKVSAIAGYAGQGKGPLATQLALSVAAGLPFLGHATVPCPVLYLDAETGRLAEIRVHRIARALGLNLADLPFCFLHAEPIDEEWLDALEENVRDLGDDPASPNGRRRTLVVLDSYTSLVGGDQNAAEYADAAKILGRMSRELDAVFMAVAHEKKPQQGRRGSDLEMLSGHNAMAAMFQCVWSLSHPTADATLFEVRCARSPEEPFTPFYGQWVDVRDPGAREPKGDLARAAAPKGVAKWGLIAERRDAPMGDGEDQGPDRDFGAEAIAWLEGVRPNGDPVAVADMVGGLAPGKRTFAAREAIRELVNDGVLLANFEVRTWTDRVPRGAAVWFADRRASRPGHAMNGAPAPTTGRAIAQRLNRLGK